MCNNETVEFMFEMTITRTGIILLGLYSVIVNSEKKTIQCNQSEPWVHC